jgi:hypothetical protein
VFPAGAGLIGRGLHHGAIRTLRPCDLTQTLGKIARQLAITVGAGRIKGNIVDRRRIRYNALKPRGGGSV